MPTLQIHIELYFLSNYFSGIEYNLLAAILGWSLLVYTIKDDIV